MTRLSTLNFPHEPPPPPHALPSPRRATFAADLPSIPKDSIAEKKELLFSDDFKGATPDQRWKRSVDTFTFENGSLKGTQTRDTAIPATDDKPAVPPHPAVFGLEVPTKDSVVEVKIRFEGNTLMDVEFDDREANGYRAGLPLRPPLPRPGQARQTANHHSRRARRHAEQQAHRVEERPGCQQG